MKRSIALKLIVIAGFLMAITACSTDKGPVQTGGDLLPTESTPAEITTVAETPVTTETQTAATATLDVDALIQEKLQNHHDIARIYNAQKTREEWNTTLDRMIGYGAKISDEEKQIIIDYLMNR